MTVAALQEAGRVGRAVCGIPACLLNGGEAAAAEYVYAPSMASDLAAARDCLRLSNDPTGNPPYVAPAELALLGDWAVAVKSVDSLTRTPKCELVVKPAYRNKKHKHFVAIRLAGIIGLKLGVGALAADPDLVMKLDARPASAALNAAVTAACDGQPASCASTYREMLATKVVFDGAAAPLAPSSQTGQDDGDDDDDANEGDEGEPPPFDQGWVAVRSWWRQASSVLSRYIADARINAGLVKELLAKVAAALRLRDLQTPGVPAREEEPPEGPAPAPPRITITARWDFWYTALLMREWMPGPASAWPAVLDRAAARPPSTKRKKEGAAAVAVLHDQVIGAGLGGKFLTWVQLAVGQQGTATSLVVSKGAAKELSMFMHAFGRFLLGHLAERRFYTELNKWWKTECADLADDAQSVMLVLGGGGRYPTCPFSAFESTAFASVVHCLCLSRPLPLPQSSTAFEFSVVHCL